MSESTGEVTVTVDTPEPDAAPEVAPVVVVADTGDGDSGNSDAVVENAHALGTLEERVKNLEDRVFTAELDASIALDVAETAIEEAFVAEEIAVKTAVETEEDKSEPEEDSTPEKPHLIHRSFSELFGGGKR